MNNASKGRCVTVTPRGNGQAELLKANPLARKPNCRVSFDNSETRFDIPGVSDLDLNNLLEGWPHEPGQVKARKIAGSDGREKVQLRIDLGLIQMELNGRPDGQRPHGFESLLEYHKARAKSAKESGNNYLLGEAELLGLQQEGVQYYHRYLS